MRKFFVLFTVLTSLVSTNNAKATCALTQCNHGAGLNPGYANREMLTPDGKTGNALDNTQFQGNCFVCNNSSAGTAECGANDKVAIITNNKLEKVYYCDKGIYDSWEEFDYTNNTPLCGDSPLNTSISGAIVSYRDGDSQSRTSAIAQSQLITNSQYVKSLCKYIDCPAGKTANNTKNGCVDLKCKKPDGTFAQTDDSIDTECNSSLNFIYNGLNSFDHIKPGQMCTAKCTAADTGWNITLKSNACEQNYTPDSDNKKCILVATVKDQLKRECESSGGTWSNDICTCDVNKNLIQSGSKCECKDANYEYDSTEGKCNIKDTAADKQACDALSDATWNENDLKCICNDKTFDFNRAQKKCIKNTQAALCEKIGKNEAQFNEISRKCECLDHNKEINASTQKCEETAAAKAAREKQENQQNVKDKILATRDAMKKITDTLGTSVWKNKEGNFNTARLASDSIAGVVLGTAGGLITSNIVKKNQVKHGFEKLNCSIGGQTVASFGDDFSVGISAQ